MGKNGQWDSSFNEWINLAEFLHGNTYLRKLSYFSSYWVGMVKYGCVLLGHKNLKSAIPQLKINQ